MLESQKKTHKLHWQMVTTCHQQKRQIYPSVGYWKKGTDIRFFDDLRINLILLGQLCDGNCVITLTKKKALVMKHNKLIMEAN